MYRLVTRNLTPHASEWVMAYPVKAPLASTDASGRAFVAALVFCLAWVIGRAL